MCVASKFPRNNVEGLVCEKGVCKVSAVVAFLGFFFLPRVLTNLLTLRLIATDTGLVFRVILLTAASPEKVVFLGR